MPELPEVETVKQGLCNQLHGQTIAHATLYRDNLRTPFPSDFTERLTNRALTQFNRRSKYLLITLDNGPIWLSHLGMSGKFTVIDDPNEPLVKHDHLEVTFTSGTRLVYNDSRRFGLMDIIEKGQENAHPLLQHLGPEPLDDNFHQDHLYNALHHRTTPIKHAIMNAKYVVGVGNIYASESLFRSHIHPATPCNQISQLQYHLLHQAIIDVLTEAIESGGSTLRDYRNASGSLGYFQHRFHVYDRAGKACTLCQTPIEKIVQQGRSSFFCPSCQPISH